MASFFQHHNSRQPKFWRALFLRQSLKPPQFTAVALLVAVVTVSAQPSAPPAQDPLMSLMLSQPKIDVESPVQAIANFDPPLIRPGERVTYRVVLNALEASIEWPEKLPNTGKLELARGGRGQLMTMAASVFQPSTTFNYHARPTEAGHFTVPEFTIQVYGKPVTIAEAQLDVRTDLPASLPPPPQLVLEIIGTNIFVGQAVKARVLSPPQPGGVVQGLAQVQVSGQGFIADAATARSRIDPLPRGLGAGGLTFVHEVTLTPIASGKLSAFAQGYTVGNRAYGGVVISGPGIVPGAAAQYTLVDSDPVGFDVRALPREGELPGFTGAVGNFRVEPPQLATNLVRVGDPVKLMVRVHGDGNLVRLVAPPPPRLRDWQVFAGQSDTTHPQIIQAQGFATFVYTLVPLNDKTQASPEIPFSCFDPAEARYVDCKIPSVPVTIAPGAMPVDLAIIGQAQAATEPEEREPVLSGLANAPGLAAASLVPLQRQAWFPLVQLAPATAFLGLWGWERRRRFFEAHPGALLRRRARRALRRQRRAIRRAARSGDTSAFATAAVGAMRVACSPHYPAEPRALVGVDVVAVLPETARSGSAGRIVRRFFEATDASRFGGLPGNGSDLLSLRGELDEVLDSLEARL